MHRFRSAVMLTRAAVAVAVLLLCATSADAAQCSVSASSVSFGTYNVFAAVHNDSTGTITLNCNGGAHAVKVEISSGGASSFALRRMLKGTEQLRYNLYLDAARTIVWGNGSGGSESNSVGNPPNNQNVTLTIFARVPAAQDVSAGSYTDSPVTVTVNY